MIRPIARQIPTAWPALTYGIGRQPTVWKGAAVSQPVLDDDTLNILEPPGSVPRHVKGRMSGWGEPPNLSTTTVDASKLQAYIRMAERGETYNLFAYYRDTVLGNSHVQSEAAKRKMVVAGQPFSLQPYDKTNPEDKKACEVIKAMIDDCENWDEGIMHLMDAQLWPMATSEKIFSDVEPDSNLAKLECRLRFCKFVPVNPTLISYRIAFMAQGGFNLPNVPGMPSPQYVPLAYGGGNNPADTTWNPDDWQPEFRFYRCFANGNIDFSYANMYSADPARHVVFRESTLSGIRDNMGGPMRSLIFWHFLSMQARDWFSRSMQRFGSPFVVIQANMAQSDTVKALTEQLNFASQVNGFVAQLGTKVELKETSTAGMAEGYKIFIDLCNDEISKVICGQVSSSGQRKSGGMNSGQEKLQSEVRDDLALYDKKMLNECLRRQLFSYFLKWNGFKGQPPKMVFGGTDAGEMQQMTQSVATLKGAGLRVADSSLETISEYIGLEMERDPIENTPVNGEKDTNKNPSSKRS